MHKNSKWMEIAEIAASNSKDPKTKVGAVIVSNDNRMFSLGYNGFAKGYPDDKSLWENSTEKHKRVIHAEINAIINCPFDTVGCSIYVTVKPCHKCMPVLINAGIKNIYYQVVYKNECENDLTQDYHKYFDKIEQVSSNRNPVKTSKEWLELFNDRIKILKPIGWETELGYDYSFNQELVTLDTFKDRVFMSTCDYNFNGFSTVQDLFENMKIV